MKQINSETFTWLKAAASKTGTQHGGLGLATRENSQRIAAWLGQQAVKDVDKAAVLRASSHGVGLEVRTELRYPVGSNGERMGCYQVAVGCRIIGTTKNRIKALADLENFQTPAPTRQIEEWLAELSVISASRSREEMESALMINAYASRLGEYPADVVRSALIVQSWKWWPTWDELRSYCEAKAGPRRRMILALQHPERPAEPEMRPATAEEKARMQAMVDEKFPNRSPHMRKAAVDEATKGNCINDALTRHSPDLAAE